MNSSSKVSVIVPIYKVEKYLKRCIESIINQTHKNLEIILVNDGSPDNSGAICDEYLEKDSRIQVIHQKNKGLSGARNSGLRIASGDYIAFVDSDDWIDLKMYEEMLSHLLKHNVDVVECNIVQRYDTEEKKSEENQSIELQDRLVALKRIVSNQQFSVCRRLYSKHIIEGIFFPEGKISEDVYFTSTLFERLKKIVFLSNPYYNYYVVTESITRGPYKLKTLESIDAALYLKNKIYSTETDIDLLSITDKFVMTILLYNYKLLHHNPTADEHLIYRKKVRKLIQDNFSKNTVSIKFLLAKNIPPKIYRLLISFYKSLKPNAT